MLGDWFATGMLWRPQVAMFVNERKLLPFFVPLAPTAALFDRAPVAPTNDRSVLGVTNGDISTKAPRSNT